MIVRPSVVALHASSRLLSKAPAPPFGLHIPPKSNRPISETRTLPLSPLKDRPSSDRRVRIPQSAGPVPRAVLYATLPPPILFTQVCIVDPSHLNATRRRTPAVIAYTLEPTVTLPPCVAPGTRETGTRRASTMSAPTIHIPAAEISALPLEQKGTAPVVSPS
jgi:hypothetical protein